MSNAAPASAQPIENTARMHQRLLWLALAVGLAIILPVEFRRWQDGGWAGWLTSIHPDTTAYLLIFLLLPALWFLKRRNHRWNSTPLNSKFFQTWFGPGTKPEGQTRGADRIRAIVLATIVALVSWMTSSHLGHTEVLVATPYEDSIAPLSELPPAFHDEYSYLFQAKTFLAGRISNSSRESCSELFDQIHVLNDNGIYASRYFPGTGLWMMPFVAIEKPYLGHWLAGALSAAFVFSIGRELAGNAVGLLAGLLVAVSPGIVTFGQLLLAHHPTLLGLTFFAWMFLRMMRTRTYLSAFLAGAGLIFAALCRPMTAAGIGLPFGIWLLVWWLRGSVSRNNANEQKWNFTRRTQLLVSMAVPIGLGLGGMMVYNSQLTGKPYLTPYQLYTDIYTPRHVYGFHNVERAKSSTSTKVIEKYDRWAENLTPSLAMRNVKDRLIASGQWILGLVPLAMALSVFPFLAGRRGSGVPLADPRWWLILLAAVSLHIVHIPYWFQGIRNWHYVFEAAPFVLLAFAGVTGTLLASYWKQGLIGICLWWMSLLAVSLWMAYGPLPGQTLVPRVRAALGEDIWARRNYAGFNAMLDRVITDRPALVLVAEDPADRHIDYVTNDPPLDAQVIRGRFRPELRPLNEVVQCFPDRAIYVVVLNPAVVSNIDQGFYQDVQFDYLAEEPIVSGRAVVYRLSLPIDKNP